MPIDLTDPHFAKRRSQEARRIRHRRKIGFKLQLQTNAKSKTDA